VLAKLKTAGVAAPVVAVTLYVPVLKFARTSSEACPEASEIAVLPRGKVTPAFDALSDVNVTVAPDTGLSNLSRTRTRSVLKPVPISAVCGVPAIAEIVAAGVEGDTMDVPNAIRLKELDEV
jgi:hypothetical protein